MSVVVAVFISLIFKEYKAQCLTDIGSCSSNTVSVVLPDLNTAPFPYIQTFNIESCVSDHQLEISEVSIWYKYYTSSAFTLDFKIEFFIPSSLNAFSSSDRDDPIATAQTSATLGKTFITSTKRVIFSNLNITLGCNSLYAMFVYPLNCNNGADPVCDSTAALRELNVFVCSIPTQQETLFGYINNGNVPPELNILSPEFSMANYKMDVDIVYRYTILCIPTTAPTQEPTESTDAPIKGPTQAPSEHTNAPTIKPTNVPTNSLTQAPIEPTNAPTKAPTKTPTETPTESPTKIPTTLPTSNPSRIPTIQPTTAFNEGEVSPLHSTSLQSESAQTKPANKKRITGPIIITVVAIISFLAIVSITYSLYIYYSTKKMTKQVMSSVMETPNDGAQVDDVVNCNIQDTKKKAGVETESTDEHLEETEETVHSEGAQNEVCVPGLVMCGSAKTVKKNEDEDTSASEDLWDIVPQTNQGTDDGIKAKTSYSEGPNSANDVISETEEGGNNDIVQETTMGSNTPKTTPMGN